MGVSLRVVRRRLHVRLGELRVVEVPVGHGSDRNPGLELLRARHDEQRVRPAAAPAPDADARGVHPRLRLQPLHAGDDVVELDVGHHLADDEVLERLALAGGAPRVHGEDDVAGVDEDLVEECVAGERVVPGVVDGRRARAAVDVDDRRVLLRGIEAAGLQDPGRQGEAVGGRHGEERGRLEAERRDEVRSRGRDHGSAGAPPASWTRQRRQPVVARVEVGVGAPVRAHRDPCASRLPS